MILPRRLGSYGTWALLLDPWRLGNLLVGFLGGKYLDPSGAANVSGGAANVVDVAASLGAGAADAGAAYIVVASTESFGGSGDTGRLG